MTARVGSECLLLLLAVFGWGQTQSASCTQDQTGAKAAAGATEKKTLLLKDFKPVSMLHTAVHQVPRAKFYVIDVHNHENDARGSYSLMPPQRVMDIMDATNVKTVVIPNVMVEFGAREAELGAAASTSARIFRQISGPDHVRHRQRDARRDVSQSFPLAGNCG